MTTTLETSTAPEAPAARRRWFALGAIGLAQLLVIIDMTIMSIALPSAQRDLGMSDATRQWTLTGYTLAFGGLLLLGGRLADRLGRKNTLIIGALGFAAASAVGGAATGSAMLIAARAAQGVFAALLAPSALSLLTITFPEPRERAKAFGVFSAIMMSGAAVGLLVGGALAEFLDWRWCMYVNLPIAIVAALLGWVLLPKTERHQEARLDWTSAVLGSVGIVGLVYGLGEAGEAGFAAGKVLIPMIAGVLLLGVFVLRQARSANPLLPLSVVLDRNRGAGFLTIAIAAFGMFGMFLFLTFQLQGIMHYGAFQAGLAFLPLIGANIVTSTQITRRLSQRTGPRPLLVIGLLLLAGGLAMLTQLTTTSSYAAVVLPAELLLGFGAGLAMPTVFSVATIGVPAKDSGVASAFITTSQQVGSSLGVAVLNTIATSATAASVVRGPAAVVHGFAVASGWATAVLVAGAAAVAVLLRTRPAKLPAMAGAEAS